MASGFVEITDVLGLKQFLTNYRWNISFQATGKLKTQLARLNGLNLRAESVTLPKITTPAVEAVIRGHKVKQAGIVDYGNTLTITSFETNTMDVFNLIEEWRKLIWSNDAGNHGVQQNKEDYVCQLTIQRLNNLNQIIQDYTVFNCWMEDNDVGGDLDASTADPTKPTLTLSFDYYTVNHGLKA